MGKTQQSNTLIMLARWGEEKEKLHVSQMEHTTPFSFPNVCAQECLYSRLKNLEIWIFQRLRL